MRLLALVALVMGASDAQTFQPSVVLPSNGRFQPKNVHDIIDLSDPTLRQDYRNSFQNLNHFAGVDFFVSPERPTGLFNLGTKETVVTADKNTYLESKPNKDCPSMCTFEDRQIEELKAKI